MSTMEAALSCTGWGGYSKFLFGFTAACYFSNAMVFMTVPLYLPLISCDIAMNNTSVRTLEICFSLGLALGGFFFSAISDVVGRKCILTISLVLIFMGSLFGAFSYNSPSFIMSQTVIASGIASNLNVGKLLVAETLPMKQRFICIVLLDIFWLLGILVSIGLSFASVPLMLKYKYQSTRIFTWRIMQILVGTLAIVLAGLSSLLLESPRYLIFERRPNEALDVLRQIFAVNKAKLFDSYPFSERDLQGKIIDFGISQEPDVPNNLTTKRCKVIFNRVHKSMLVLVRRRFFPLTFVTICLNILTNISLYQLLLLLTKTLKSSETSMLSGIQMQYFEESISSDCERNYEIPFEMLKEFCILSIGCLTGILTLAMLLFSLEYKYLMGKLCSCLSKREQLLIATTIVIAVSTLTLSGAFSVMLTYLFFNHYYLKFGFSMLVLNFYAMSRSGLLMIVINAFPTAVRGTALGETMIAARLLNMFLKNYLWISSWWFFLGLAIALAMAAFLSFMIPKVKNLPMVD